jgi:alpha-methylacyl-CoA racemase
MLLAFGVVCALLERERSGLGQVVDAAMVDGAALLATQLYALRAAGQWHRERGTNVVDGGAPFYDTYETSDGKYVAVGAVEPQFYAVLLERLGLDGEHASQQNDEAQWHEMKARIAGVIRTRSRDEWTAEFEGTEGCLTPILDYDEAHLHPHISARQTFVECWNVLQPAPAPRFSRTPGRIASPPPAPGRDTDTALTAWGFEECDVSRLRDLGAIA